MKKLYYDQFGKHLRIGNMLYSYAFLLKYAKKFNRELILPDYYLWKYLKNPPKIGNIEGSLTFHFRHDGLDLDYVDQFFTENADKDIIVNLNPYTQSEEWFLDYKDYILQMLEFKGEEIQKVKNQYSDILNKPTIGISIRLGTDFTHNDGFYHVPNNWYIDVLDQNFLNWRNDYSVIIFSDNIAEAKTIFRNYPFNYAEQNKTHVLIYDSEHFHSEKAMNHLILMSLMDNMLISNSTFSWWGSYLAQNNKKGDVYCTGKNFANKYYQDSKNNDTFYPKSWKIV